MDEVREITEQYRLEKVLKSSTSGVVFRANDPTSGSRVVIKLINRGPWPDQQECARRFLAAMKTVRELALPAFPAIVDFGITPDGTAFVVLEHLDGQGVDALAGAPPGRILPLLDRAAESLERFVAAGLVHHNIAPENMLLSGGPAGERIVLLGLGSAAFRPGGLGPRPELPSPFAAPELAGESSESDFRSDIYSYAMTTCHLLGARVGPAGAAVPSVELPEFVAAFVEEPESLRAILQRCLRRDPAQRPSSFAEVRTGLVESLEGGGLSGETRVIEVPPGGVGTPAVEAVPVPGPALSEPPPRRDVSTAPIVVPVDAGTKTDEEDASFQTQRVSHERIRQTLTMAIKELPGAEAVAIEGGDARPTPPGAPTSEATVMVDARAMVPPPLPEEPKEEQATRRIILDDVAEPVVAPGPTIGAQTDLPPVGGEGPGAELTSPPPEGFVAPVGPPPPPVLPPGAVLPTVAPRFASAPEGGPPVPPPAGPLEETPVASLESAPTEPAAPVPPAPEQQAVAVPAPAVPLRPSRPVRQGTRVWPFVLLGVAVLLLGITGAFVVVTRILAPRRPSVTARPTAVPTRVAAVAVPTAVPAVVVALQEAEAAISAGDLEAARVAVERISGSDEARMTVDEARRLQGVRDALAQQRRTALLRALDRGLATGNLDQLRRTVSAFSGADAPELAGDARATDQLKLARQVLDAWAGLEKTFRDRRYLDAVEQATALLSSVPKAAAVQDVRQRSAEVVEAEADALVRRGEFDAGIARYESLARAWPGRSGLAARIDRAKAEQRADQQVSSALSEAAKAGEEGHPETGLDRLAGIEAGPRWQDRIKDVRQRLQQQLAQLDKGAPSLQLRPGFKLEYEKNKGVVVPVKITDDHGVVSVTAFGRVGDAKQFESLPVKSIGGGEYGVDVAASFHRNEAVEFYVVATDASGHSGTLGSREAPIKLKKKRWLF